MTSSFPPPPSPPSPPQPPPHHPQPSIPDRVELTIFVDNLPEFVGHREIFSHFCSFGRVTDVFIPSKRTKSGSRFGFVKFDRDVAAGLTILNTNGQKFRDNFLHVRKAVYGRRGSIVRNCGSLHTTVIAGGGRSLSFKATLLREKVPPVDSDRMGCSVSPIVITGESHDVERLSRSCVVEWMCGTCFGIQASALLSDLGVESKVSQGISMHPWSKELVLKPLREVWIRCVGIPLHARCPNTFLSIGRHWGEVLSVEFGSVECGDLDDGRIHLLTEMVAPLVVEFKLKVDEMFFDCWIIEEGLGVRQVMQQMTGLSSHGWFAKDHRELIRTPEVAMGDSETMHRSLDPTVQPTADDSDNSNGLPASSSEVSSDQWQCSDVGGFEDGCAKARDGLVD
ncbi:hypothetical protein Dimus_019065 [Dionaea muscipula]